MNWEELTFGDRFSRLREAKQLTLTALSEATEIPPHHLSRWECDWEDPKNLPPGQVARLASALGVSVPFLVTGRESP